MTTHEVREVPNLPPHLMELVNDVCSRVSIVEEGKKRDMSPDERALVETVIYILRDHLGKLRAVK